MESEEEYYCSECNSKVGKNDTVCGNCGTDLTEVVVESTLARLKEKILSFINKFGKYHRISYYLFLGPLLILFSGIILVVLDMIYYELFKDAAERLGIDFIFGYFSYLTGVALAFLPVFIFTYLYLEVRLKLKIFITISVMIFFLLSFVGFKYFSLNTAGSILLAIILLEISYVKYTKKDYSVLIIVSILFLGWFQFLSLGELPRETVIKDYNEITKPMNVIKTKVDVIGAPEDFGKYDRSVPYIIITPEDTLQLILNYNKIRTAGIPSQHWKLINWKIDSVFSSVYYYPKPKI